MLRVNNTTYVVLELTNMLNYYILPGMLAEYEYRIFIAPSHKETPGYKQYINKDKRRNTQTKKLNDKMNKQIDD